MENGRARAADETERSLTAEGHLMAEGRQSQGQAEPEYPTPDNAPALGHRSRTVPSDTA